MGILLDAKVDCPKCGSPNVIKMGFWDRLFSRVKKDLVCLAGDCGYVGPVKKPPTPPKEEGDGS